MPADEPPIPPPILVPPSVPVIFEPRQTNIERSLAIVPPNQVVAPNRPSDLPLPLMLLPEDLPLTASPLETNQLEERTAEIDTALRGKSRNNIRSDQRESEIVQKYIEPKQERDDPILQLELLQNTGEFRREEEGRRPLLDPLTYQNQDILSLLGAMQLQL